MQVPYFANAMVSETDDLEMAIFQTLKNCRKVGSNHVDKRGSINCAAIVVRNKSDNKCVFIQSAKSEGSNIQAGDKSTNNFHSEVLLLKALLAKLNIEKAQNYTGNDCQFILEEENKECLSKFKITIFTERQPCDIVVVDSNLNGKSEAELITCDYLLRELAFYGASVSIFYAVPNNYGSQMTSTLTQLLEVVINAREGKNGPEPSIVTRCIFVGETVYDYKNNILLRNPSITTSSSNNNVINPQRLGFSQKKYFSMIQIPYSAKYASSSSNSELEHAVHLVLGERNKALTKEPNQKKQKLNYSSGMIRVEGNNYAGIVVYDKTDSSKKNIVLQVAMCAQRTISGHEPETLLLKKLLEDKCSLKKSDKEDNREFILKNKEKLLQYEITLFIEKKPCNVIYDHNGKLQKFNSNPSIKGEEYIQITSDSLLRELAFFGVSLSVYYAIPNSNVFQVQRTLELLLPHALDAYTKNNTSGPAMVTRCIFPELFIDRANKPLETKDTYEKIILTRSWPPTSTIANTTTISNNNNNVSNTQKKQLLSVTENLSQQQPIQLNTNVLAPPVIHDYTNQLNRTLQTSPTNQINKSDDTELNNWWSNLPTEEKNKIFVQYNKNKLEGVL